MAIIKVICDYNDKPHELNSDDRPCSNPTSRYGQWQPCPENNQHQAEWYPQKSVDDPRWYVRCKYCNIDGYVKPTWPMYSPKKGK